MFLSSLRASRHMSVSGVIQRILEMWARFPFVTAATIVGVFMALRIIRDMSLMSGSYTPEVWVFKSLLLSLLACPFLVGLTLLSERFRWSRQHAWLLQGAGIALLVLYYVILPQDLEQAYVQTWYRFALFNALAYLGIILIPWVGQSGRFNIWTYFKFLLTRFMLTAIFAATLFLGLAAGLGAVMYLFDVDFLGIWVFFQLWTAVVGIFGTWFFLAGFPVTDQEKGVSASKEVSSLFLYILLPLLTFFLIILYVYAITIIARWSWPLGGVAQWVLMVGAFGFFCYFLGQPLLDQSKYRWLRKYFFIVGCLMVPLTMLLFWAIGIRVREYGLTEHRYAVIVAGLWLAGVTIYLLVSREKRLEYAFLSLALILVFSMVGPWSAFSLSLRSQVNELRQELEAVGLLVNGKIQKKVSGGTSSYAWGKEFSIRSKVNYIASHNGADRIQPWFPEDLRQAPSQDNQQWRQAERYVVQNNAMRQLGAYDSLEASRMNKTYSLHKEERVAVPASGYEEVVIFNVYGEQAQTVRSTRGTVRLQITNENHLRLLENDTVLIDADLSPWLRSLMTEYGQNQFETAAPTRDMVFMSENDNIKISIVASSLVFIDATDRLPLVSVSGLLLFTRK